MRLQNAPGQRLSARNGKDLLEEASNSFKLMKTSTSPPMDAEKLAPETSFMPEIKAPTNPQKETLEQIIKHAAKHMDRK